MLVESVIAGGNENPPFNDVYQNIEQIEIVISFMFLLSIQKCPSTLRYMQASPYEHSYCILSCLLKSFGE